MMKNYDSVEARFYLSSTLSSKQENTSYSSKKRMILSFLTVFVALFSFTFMSGQSMANYAFSSTTNASLENLTSGSVSLLQGNRDDNATNVTAIGFDFFYMGTKYTHFSANSNGQVRLHISAADAAIAASSITTYALNTVTLAPMAGDNEVNDGMKMKVIGAAPNRKLVVEWTQFYVQYNNITNAGNMQLWLNETSGVIDFVYGDIYNSSTSVQNRSVFVSSGNSATASGHVLIGTTPTFVVGSSPATNAIAASTVTSGVASPLVANLGSSADGTRVKFQFTPQTTVLGDVANLTFSAVTTNNTTVNWVDNANNETNFIVTRATDAGFTQNVVNSLVVSTTPAGTGSAYTSIQTGLSAGTTYYYKVIAAVEGGSSVGLTGTQATLNGATYYWTGATGGAWNAFTNWNTTADGSGSVPTVWADSDINIIDGAGTTPGGALTIVVDRASFTLGQIQITSNTNLTLESSATTTRLITISGGPGDDFILETGSALNLISATKAISILFSGSSTTGVIAGTFIASGSTSNVINTTGGIGTLVKVTATGSVTSNLNSATACIIGNATSLLFENGSNYTHSNSTTVNYIPTATWETNATATLNGNTTGTSLTSASPSLGNLVVNTTASTSTLSAFAANSRIIQGNLTVNSTGTGRFRAITSGVLQILGNLTVNGGIFEVGSTTGGGVIVKGITTVSSGATLDVNQSTLQLEGNMVNNGTVLSSETTTANSRLNFINTVNPQTLSGSGLFSGRISSFGLSNTFGLTVSTPVLTQRVNLFAGTITGSSNITIGTGLALGAAVQIGQAANPTSGGSFDVAPIFNLGTGNFTVLYSNETTPRTTGFEIPASRTVNNVTVDNANGLTISGGTIEVLNALTLTSGIITSNLSSHIVHGSATAAGTLTGGSATNYFNGPIVRTINDANPAANFIFYPVGKAGVYAPVLIAPTTTSASKFRVEAFDVNSGTADSGISNLAANRRWEAVPVSGTFTDIKVRLADASFVADNLIVQAQTAAGVYSGVFGNVATFTAGTPNTIESITALPFAAYTGFLSYAEPNACAGVPTPGNTLVSVPTVCLGESVTLSLQNTTSGTGVTYQWKSSTDGVTYTAIVGATNSTVLVTPAEITYYFCEVTCVTGAVTGTSTAVQVTFTNSITASIPAASCGTGVVTLEATPSTGATISWYDASTGGTLVGSGNTFTTPSITSTTTYYASAGTASNVTATIGTNATLTSTTDQPTAFCNRWNSYWSQTIYTAAELNAAGLSAGNISSLAYDITTLGDAATNANFTVKIGATSGSAFATNAFLSTAAFTTVYGPSVYTHTASGWQIITFATPYVWDGVSNIVINVTHDGANNLYNSQTYYTATPDNKVLYATNFLGTTTTGSTSVNRLNIRFGGASSCVSPRVAVIATVTPITTNSTTVSACETYTWAVNGTVYSTSGTYSNVIGCNTETLVLTINALPVSTITRVDDTLTTAETGATYQWILCDGLSTPIVGANNQTFVATATGSYAVIVTKNGCSATSDCFDVTTLSNNSFDLTKLSYYPNPVIDTFTVTYAGTISSVQVYDISGRLVKNINANANQVAVDMSDMAASVYIVKVGADKTSGEFKVIKK